MWSFIRCLRAFSVSDLKNLRPAAGLENNLFVIFKHLRAHVITKKKVVLISCVLQRVNRNKYRISLVLIDICIHMKLYVCVRTKKNSIDLSNRLAFIRSFYHVCY